MLMVVSLALPAAAIAQNDQQTPSQPSAGTSQRPGNAQLAAADRKFVHDAAVGGMLEVELGKLAVQKATSEQVRQFGQRMVDDHSQASEQLKAIAQTKGITLPDSLDAKHRKELERLQKLSGAEFDQAYMNLMLEDHQKDIREFRKVAQQGLDPDIKSVAATTLPKLHDHLAMARSAARMAKSADRTKKPSATGAAESDRALDKTTGDTTNDASGKVESKPNRDSTAPESEGKTKE
jgi:putative membrane protein